jgi:hypothetical protein
MEEQALEMPVLDFSTAAFDDEANACNTDNS